MTAIRAITETQCPNGCCRVYQTPYMPNKYKSIHKERRKRGGVVLIDTDTNKILLVQSRGQKWGPPKGTMDPTDESIEYCALRELKEETGISLNIDAIRNADKHTFAANTLYFIKCKENEYDARIQNIYGNDANGIAWVSIQCLNTMVQNKTMDINSFCKHTLKKLTRMSIA